MQQDPDTSTSRQPYSAASPATVLTVNYPLQYFAQRIGGEFVEARFPGPSDEDPAYWTPDIDTAVEYQNADLIVLNGAGYANWVKNFSLPLAKQINSSAGFTDLLLPLDDKVAHTHGPRGEHVHDDLAFTVWLDPELAKLQATAIRDALVPLLPGQTEMLDANLLTLASTLRELDKEFARMFKSRTNQKIIYSHPVYQYLDRRYQLNGISIHWEPGLMPSDDEFAQLSSMQGAIMIWEAEPLTAMRTRLETIGIASVVFETCAVSPAKGDYLDVMRTNLQRLRSALP